MSTTETTPPDEPEARAVCEHFYASHCYRGMSISLCMTCGEPDWDDLERQLSAAPSAATAGAPESTLERVLAVIRNVDAWLDAEVGGDYGAEPLGQDWARVAKAAEEAGEAIAALIAVTGQNPRKGVCGSRDDLLGELADVACTGMFAIQHFTKDETQTAAVIMAAMEKAARRAAEAGYGD